MPTFQHINHWNRLLDSPQIESGSDHNHFVQFYEKDEFLSDTISYFVAAGLAKGEAAILIMTPAHQTQLIAALRAEDLDTDQFILSGQLQILDAADTLASFMVNGKPNVAKFEETVGIRLQKLKDRFPRVRAYGEMVGLLWDAGNIEATIQLEEIWNLQTQDPSLVLMCGYALKSFSSSTPAQFQSICETHTHTLPSENYIGIQSTEEQLRTIALLQFQVASLQARLNQGQRMQNLLITSDAFKNAIIDSSLDCIKVLDFESRLLFMSKGGMKELEIDDFQSVSRKSWLNFWKGMDHMEAVSAFEKAKSGKVAEFTGFCPTTKTRSEKWWNVVLSPLQDANGKIVNVLAVSRDVTERKKYEESLEQLADENAELYHQAQESIRARDEFLSIASHELKTPITSLKMQLDMTRRKLLQDNDHVLNREKLKKVFDVSCKQVQRMTDLVEDMLDISRIQVGKLGLCKNPMNLSEMVSEVTERFQEQFDLAGCKVSLNLQSDVEGTWDRSRLEQVVVNFLSNALKYAPGKPIEIRVDQVGKKARLVVKDFGPGIPRAIQESIFQRFERASYSRNISGLGLGLFIVKEIVQNHEGSIYLDSDIDKGAQFTVELPLS